MSSAINGQSANRGLRRPAAAALVMWVAVPCTVLAALAGPARFSHGWPEPPEQWALGAVLVVQWLLAALIFPRLLSGLWPAAAALALAAPPIAAAAALGQRGLWEASVGWMWLCLWLMALAALGRLSSVRRMGWIPATVAVGFAAAPVLAYLGRERGAVGESMAGSWFPSTSPHWWEAMVFPAVILAAAGLFWIFFQRGMRREVGRPQPDNKFSTI